MSFEPHWGTLPARALRSESLSARSERGAVELFVPAPGVSVIRVAGRLETDLARQLTDAYEPTFAEARHLRAFMDCELMTGYDSEARSHLTQWVIRHRSQVRGCWVLTGSKLVAMGITVADTALSLAGVGRIRLVKRPGLIAAIEVGLDKARRAKAG
ncbi:MAG: hypothetical protein AB7S68_23505 [Polyangiaceae bacterium]